MSLPTNVEYQMAIQAAGIVLPEETLRACKVDCNPMGMPLAWSGSNAIVFRLRRPDGRPLAFRCLTQRIQDVENRYQAYSAFYKKAPQYLKSALVPAIYLARGIHVPGGSDSPWKPAIVMDWVEGGSLGAWVEAKRGKPSQLRWLQGNPLAHEAIRTVAVLGLKN